jgi:hypothetical protein
MGGTSKRGLFGSYCALGAAYFQRATSPYFALCSCTCRICVTTSWPL